MPIPQPTRLPVSTYRLQLNRDFTLRDAARIVPYLSDLGITEVYCSPVSTATPGSRHGYDICDYSRVNPELGGEEALANFASCLKERNMGLILDFVPNHMGIDETVNVWWRDVLENGPSSRFARFFDIDWDPLKQELQNKVLLPILRDQYGAALDRAEMQIVFRSGEFSLRYFDHDLPLNPRQLQILLKHDVNALTSRLPANAPELTEFLSILFHMEHLPAYQETETGAVADRQREKEVAKHRLAALLEHSEVVREHIERNIREFNGSAGQPESFRLLHNLLEAQPYRLAFWQTATHEINYRRFFDINSLAGIRMEDDEVFRAAHAALVPLLRDGVVTGIRLDHVDGLFDPQRYFQSLHDAVGPACRAYLVVEKILSEDEELRADWAVDGTTGYEFLNVLNGIFVNTRHLSEFRNLYRRMKGAKSFTDVVYHSKKLIIETAMASELNVLAHEANRISESDPHTRDFTLLSLQVALTEVIACFPVYRTYVNSAGWDTLDESNVDSAVKEALARNPALEPSIFQFLRDLLLPRVRAGLTPQERERRLNFAMKVQQYTGPVQAKGVEDTAFYRYGPLISLNEVGGHPEHFGVCPEQFHVANQRRLERTPLSMICTSTHDTKCGEDGRARLNVLSEIPAIWLKEVRAWNRINSAARTRAEGYASPTLDDEYLYYQALLAAWPAGAEEPSSEFVQRMGQYLNKAAKEKKLRTSWINPSPAYDSAVARFVEQTLAGTRAQPFLTRFRPFQHRVAELGMINSLAQLVLKIASPGVPDFYQGSEVWNLNLVDPDNRRPVDFAGLERAFAGARSNIANVPRSVAASLLARWEDGQVKQFVTAAGLRLRRSEADLFLKGTYTGLAAAGDKSAHVIACARRFEGSTALVAVPRLVTELCGFDSGKLPLGAATWGETHLVLPREFYGTHWTNVFSGADLTAERSIPLAELFEHFPVALLVANSDPALKGTA